MTAQFQIINKILQTKDFSIVTFNSLDVTYFPNYENEFTFIKDHYNTYGNVPDRLTFADKFNDFDLVDVAEPDSFLLTELFEEYDKNKIATAFNKIKKIFIKEDGSVDEAKVVLEDLLKGGPANKAMTYVDLLTDKTRYEKYLARATGQTRPYYKTGLHELDTDLGGIDPENENMIIAARTGIGKSWMIITFAASLVLQNLTVAMYSGEMVAEKVGYRLDTLLGGIDNKAITRGDPVVMEQYRKYIDKLTTGEVTPGDKSHMYVITPQDLNGMAAVPQLESFVKRTKADVLLIDQYSLMEDIRKTGKSAAQWETVSNISKDVKALQVRLQIPVIAVAQMNRTKDDNGQNTTQIGLSDRIGQDATTVLMLDRDKEKGTLTINVVKARDGGDGRQYTYKVDFNSGMFNYIDENPTNEAAQALQDSYSSQQNNNSDSLFDGVPWDN